MAVVRHPAIDGPDRPVVSVCIANYNGEQLLGDCIDSVLAQDCDDAIEIVVHDDASTDGSVGLLLDRYPGVDLLASAANVGFCIANNRMVAHVRGEYVLLLNNDAALYPDAIRVLLTAARDGPPGILTLPQYDWQTRKLVDRGCLLDPFYNPVPNLDPARQDTAYVIGACLWIPSTLWEQLGGFPEWMESIGEDLYLGCMARLRGHPVRALPDSGYRHRQGASFGGNRATNARLDTTLRRRRLSERNKTFAMFIFTPTPLVWPMLFLHLVMLFVEAVFLGLTGMDAKVAIRIYGNVFASLVRSRHQLLTLRSQVQRTRQSTLGKFFACFRLFPRKLSLLLRHGLPVVRD